MDLGKNCHQGGSRTLGEEVLSVIISVSIRNTEAFYLGYDEGASPLSRSDRGGILIFRERGGELFGSPGLNYPY